MTTSTLVALLVTVLATASSSLPTSALATSHRRAPIFTDPPFVDGVASDEGRRAYARIVANTSISVAAHDALLADWAKKYNVQADYEKYTKNRRDEWAALNRNVTAAIGQLELVNRQMSDIFHNKSLSKQGRIAALDRLRDQYPTESETLMMMRTRMRKNFKKAALNQRLRRRINALISLG